MTRDEENQLLYIETRAVDHGGVVDLAKMNKEDLQIMERWNSQGFVLWGRIDLKDIQEGRVVCRFGSYWAELSNAAWKVVAKLRRERAERMYDARRWRKSDGNPTRRATAT